MKLRTMDRVLLGWLYSYLRPYRRWLFVAIFLLCIAKGIEAVLPFFLGRIVDQILGGEMTLSKLFVGIAWLLGALGVAYVLDIATVLIKTQMGQKGLLLLREHVFSHILHLPASFFDRTPVGQLMTRTIHDVDKISQMFTESVVPLISSSLLFLGMGIAVLWIDWIAGLALLVMVPCTFWLLHYFRVQERVAYREVRRLLSQMNTFIQEHFTGAHIIRHFGLVQREKELFAKINREHREANCVASSYYSFLFAGLEFLHSTSLILLFVVIASLSFLAQTFQAGLYFTYSLYALMFFRPLVDVAERYNVLQEALAGAERVFAILQEPVEEKEEKPALVLDGIETIVFEDVWFSYGKNEPWVLQGISFTLRQGESVGIVGVTGAGKTTIFSLLLRLYSPQRGRILINQRDIAHFSKASIRSCFSAVLQDSFLLSDTMEINIDLFRFVDKSKRDAVVSELGLSGFIEKFPLKWQERLQEKGNRLSTGEQQIVSLLRAIMHDRPVFLLDEATAHVDTQTEKALQKALGKILETKTTLIIAHRLSTIAHVDRVYVMDQGRIVEEGGHKELLEKKGVYEKLYRLSFAT